MTTEARRKHYDVCPRAPDLETFHVSVETLKARFEGHAVEGEKRYNSVEALLKSHNGYIRENQQWQSRMDGSLAVLKWMVGLALAAVLSLSGGILLALFKGDI